ncbi:hypothetical protein [Streptomyces sp. NBC_00996]|uniref:hypothetical protein n=1 Tax=Streptomyces sp. NBC_00996 TaxID=2903710 RepID=UPI003865A3A0|nr:hypothetical protein OG390_45945 [Streptomyces sp. NBC_00996]
MGLHPCIGGSRDSGPCQGFQGTVVAHHPQAFGDAVDTGADPVVHFSDVRLLLLPVLPLPGIRQYGSGSGSGYGYGYGDGYGGYGPGYGGGQGGRR